MDLTIVYIVMGVVASVAVFLYILPFIRGDNKNKKVNSSIEEKHFKKNSNFNCPVCGRSITDGDTLYIERFKAEPKDKIFTKGCNYCYDPKTRRAIKQ